MGLDKLKKLIGGKEDDEEEIKEEEYYKVSREEYGYENGVAGSKMMLLEPRAYSESQQIAEELSISQAQVSRLEKSAIKKLKKILK